MENKIQSINDSQLQAVHGSVCTNKLLLFGAAQGIDNRLQPNTCPVLAVSLSFNCCFFILSEFTAQ